MKHLYTGDGKGKTTSAIGLLIRASGSGKRVLFFQFLKDNNSNERHIIKRLENVNIMDGPKLLGEVWNFSKDKIKEMSPYYENKLKEIKSLMSDYDMVILDEAIVAINYGYINHNSLVDFIKEFPEDKELIITGTDADKEFIELFDYVMEMRKIKHPFDKGKKAREGIEY